MPEPYFSVTLEVGAESDAIMERHCVDYLTGRGYYIVAPGKPWERVGTFCKRAGIRPHKFLAMVTRYESRSGQTVKLDRRGVSRRVMAIQVNPQFETFCKATKR